MAKIKEEDIDALRERADIVEVVSGYSRLKKSGSHTFKGLCPFHSEKTPSFTVDAAKGLWHCFGCGQGGNVYHFVQKAENLPFPEAAEWLARKVGFDLRYEEMRPGEARAAGQRARLFEANEEAARFFHARLMNSPDAQLARSYLERRGFGREVAQRWQLGFAPGGDALARHLLAKGFTAHDLERADLVRKSRQGRLYDTFRARITFPTWNLQGNVVGFGARAVGGEQPKYLNTAETPVFAKSKLLYGLDRAKQAISRGAAVVVEGYTDVIALHEAGIAEAVATNGVALGETHFGLLKKFTQRVVLMLDADQAGRTATARSFDVHHRIGVEVLVALLPAGRDPAELIDEDGADAIRKVIENAQPLLQFKVEQTIDELPLDTPETRARAVREIARVLGWHPDPIARHGYALMAAHRLGVEPEGMQRALDEVEAGHYDAPGGTDHQGEGRRLPGRVKVEREALQLMLTRSQEAAGWADQLIEADFTSPSRRELFREAIAALRAGSSGPGEMAGRLSSDAQSLFTELTVGFEDGDDGDEGPRALEVFSRLKVFRLEREIKKRRETLQEVNPLDDPDRHDALFTELVGLEAQRRDLLRELEGAA